jgi:F-box-like
MLPEDVLLRIFYFDRLIYLDEEHDIPEYRVFWRWNRLAHVCQRWRSVVFGSPNFLDLKLVCLPGRRMELADIWPPLPIVVTNISYVYFLEDYDLDAAIVHHDRVCQINLFGLTNSRLQRLASTMQVQFPALTDIILFSPDRRQALALPDGFLGGSCPRLQTLRFHRIPFPALPKLLLSATDLVQLDLQNIPHSGYFSPEAIVTSLAVLANLTTLTIDFMSPLSQPDRGTRRPPPPIRIVLPALTLFYFKGVSEYLEDVVARIDAPWLDSIRITFFHQLIFDIPQLAQFMRRTTRLQAPNEAHVNFNDSGVQVGSLPLRLDFEDKSIEDKSRLSISCRDLDWQLSSLAQVFTSFFPSIYMVGHLYISAPRKLPSKWQDVTENVQWLEFFHPFIGVKSLYVCDEYAQCIAPALQEIVGERVTDVLPALESLFMEDLPPSGPRQAAQEAIGQFVAARQLSGHPVAVSDWDET